MIINDYVIIIAADVHNHRITECYGIELAVTVSAAIANSLNG